MKQSFSLIIFVFLLGATALWYFGIHRPSEKMRNSKPKTIYKTTAPIRSPRQPVMRVSTVPTTLEHGNETEMESPTGTENVVRDTTAETTDRRTSDTIDHREHKGSDEHTQAPYEQEVSEHEHSHEHAESESSKELLGEASIALVVCQVSIDIYCENGYAECQSHKSFQLESIMPAKRYLVLLDKDQRDTLITLTTSGSASARKLTHARILLKADAGEFGPAYPDKAIKAALDVSVPTIQRVRKTFALEGLEAALLPRKPSQGARPKKFDGEKEAHLIALACSEPPEGYACWTLRLLAEKMVELHHFSSISHESIRQILKKTNSVPGVSSAGVSPQKLPRHS